MLKGHERPVVYLKYNRDGDLIFSASKDRRVTAWFSENGKRLGTYEGHDGAINCLDVSRTCLGFACRAVSSCLLFVFLFVQLSRCLCVSVSLCLCVSVCPAACPTKCFPTEDSRYLITGSADCSVRVWDVKSGKELLSFEGPR